MCDGEDFVVREKKKKRTLGRRTQKRMKEGRKRGKEGEKKKRKSRFRRLMRSTYDFYSFI